MTRHLRWQILSAVLLICLSICYTSCRKMAESKPLPDVQKNIPLSSTRAGEISLWDSYRKLPQTIAYNLGDSIRFDTSRTEWIYRQTGLLTRIPTSTGTRNWLYVFQPYDAPDEIKVYAVKFYQESGNATNFTGKQVWVDLQTWKGYAVDYANNIPTGFLQPQELAYQDWEACMLNQGDFYLDVSGKIMFKDEEQAGVGMKPTGGDGCGGLIGPQRKSLWGMLGSFFGSIFTNRPGDGNWTGFGSAPPIWIPPNGLPDGDDYGGGGGGGSSPYEPPPSDPEITPVPPDQAGTLFNTNDDPGNTVPALWILEGPITGTGNGTIQIIENPIVAFVGGVLGLNQSQRNWLLQHTDNATEIRDFLISNVTGMTLEERKIAALKHLELMMTNPGYLTFVNNYDVEYFPTIGVPLLDLMDDNFIPQAPNNPITNHYDYLKCFEFSSNATYKITLAVDQPQIGTRKTFKVFSNGQIVDVGHTFLILSQNLNGVTTTRSIGLYPSESVSPYDPIAPGVLNNDQGHDYNVALTMDVQPFYFMTVVNSIKNNPVPNYNLNVNNCTSWAVYRLGSIPNDIPETIGFWPGGLGLNPGDMGEDLRSRTLGQGETKITVPAIAPANQGTCP